MIGETNWIDLTNENGNDQTSSVRVRPGCTLKLYKEYYNVGLLDSLTTDNSFLRSYDNEVSSLSCTCQGMIERVLLFQFSISTVPSTRFSQRTRAAIE